MHKPSLLLAAAFFAAFIASAQETTPTRSLGALDQPKPPSPSFSFDSGLVSISPVTKSGSVYAYGLAREPMGYYTHVQSHEAILTDAGTGAINWQFGAYTWRSIWFAVDMTTGAWVAGHPAEYAAKQIALSDKNLKKDLAGNISQLAYDGWDVEFILVRPNGGVWGASVSSRGSSDEGGEEGRVTISSLHLEPRAGTTDNPPKNLKKGDVVFIVDSFKAEYAVATVGE